MVIISAVTIRTTNTITPSAIIIIISIIIIGIGGTETKSTSRAGQLVASRW
jgi:hypothetical protein